MSDLLSRLKKTPYEKTFNGIDFGSPKSGKEYSHLFYIPPKDFEGLLPESSLFNIDTLAHVFGQVETMPDIFDNTTVEVDFGVYSDITETLQLEDDRRTYLLMLWMKKMLEITAMRAQEGGDYLKTNLNGVAAGGIQGAHNWLSREFPAYLYGNLMATSNANDCEKNIRSYIKEVEDEQVPRFCNDTKLDLVSAESYGFYASLYFTRDPDKMNYIYEITGLSEQAMQGLLTPGYYLERNLMTAMKKVKKVYASSFCKRSVGNFCSNRELGYAQWFNNSISDNPPKPLNPTSDLVALTGVRHYKPELRSYYERIKAEMPDMSFDKAWEIISSGALYNNKFIGDILLETESEGDLKIFNTPEFLRYTKMLMIQEGIGGLFIQKRVKDYIEGYEDPLLKQTSLQMPEEGGEPTIDVMSAIINPNDAVQNSTGCFFVGDDLYNLTRQQCMYENTQMIGGITQNRTGIRSTETSFWYPWKEIVPLQGTDAGGFSPLMDGPNRLTMFSSDVMMPVHFDYDTSESVHGLSSWKYKPDNNLMKNGTEEESNDVYYAGLHGVLNVTSTYGAPTFASKGNYLDINYNKHMTPEISDKEGKIIEASKDKDDLYVVIEPWTGATVKAALRLMLNFRIENDYLFEEVDDSFFLPYVYIKKEYSLSASQIHDGFGALQSALTAVLAIRIIGYGLGAILLIGGGFLIYWAIKIKKNDGLSVYSSVDDPQPETEFKAKEPMLNNTGHITIDQTRDD
uniref:Uncharacterized protein n=1 Tax=Euplotes crassus TaxID=5936 RepID=A0A7S3KSX1_EUPCR|mmetsp:Transcript_6512/g.6066  ORF Transcript_6512/g.6066 Transcript_6512/m.6066 type:complete len:740 (+) Transcript_6512:1073-3292(+)